MVRRGRCRAHRRQRAGRVPGRCAAAARGGDSNPVALTGRSRSNRGAGSRTTRGAHRRSRGAGRLPALEPRIKDEQPLVILVAAVKLLDRSLLAFAGNSDDEACALRGVGRRRQRTKLATGARRIGGGSSWSGCARGGGWRGAGAATERSRLQAAYRPCSARRNSACGRSELDLRFSQVNRPPFTVDSHGVFEAFAQEAQIVPAVQLIQ